MAAEHVAERLRGVRKRDLIAFLETDRRVREWLASGAVLGVSQAAALLGVERARIWKWEQDGKLSHVRDAGATKLYMRADLERLLRDDPPQRRPRKAASS